MPMSLLPEGWEFVARILVIIGVAGLFGMVGRLILVWLRRRHKAR